jgi:hypothetical protein
MSYSKEFNHNGRRAAGIRVQKTPTPPAEERASTPTSSPASIA